MTLAEVERAVKSRKRIQEIEAKERATYDYILADLIGRSVARIHSSANHYPTLAEAYPDLFNSAEVEAEVQARKDELSALRFKQFVNTHNNKIKAQGGTQN